MISDKIAEMKALMGFDGDDEAFVAEMKSQLASEYPDSEPEEPEKSEMMGEEEKDEEEQDEEEKKSKASELSTPLGRRIRELERKDFEREIEARVSRLSGPIPQKTINRVKSDYGKLYGKLGHDDAARMVLDGLDDVIAAEQKSFKLGSAIPQNRTRFTDPNKAATDAQVLRSAAAAKRLSARN